MAVPGKTVTVVDGDTPGIPERSFLMDISLGRDGTLFLALLVPVFKPGEPDSGLILAVPPEGEPVVAADEEEHTFPGQAGFNPHALAVDPKSGTLYVADALHQRILALDEDGTRRQVTTFKPEDITGPPATNLQRPFHLAFAPVSGDLYLADTCQVARVHGDEVTVVMGRGSSACGGPQEGTEPRSSFDTGLVATVAGSAAITGVAVDPGTGDLFAVDNHGVFRLQPDGTLLRVAGEGDRRLGERDPLPPTELDMEFAVSDAFGGGGIAIGPSGTFYLGAAEEPILMRMTLDPPDIQQIARVEDPRRLVLDGQGGLYVQVSKNRSLREDQVPRVVLLGLDRP
jgi:DNA-binding beta-propeller fold protein YncE